MVRPRSHIDPVIVFTSRGPTTTTVLATTFVVNFSEQEHYIKPANSEIT